MRRPPVARTSAGTVPHKRNAEQEVSVVRRLMWMNRFRLRRALLSFRTRTALPLSSSRSDAPRAWREWRTPSMENGTRSTTIPRHPAITRLGKKTTSSLGTGHASIARSIHGSRRSMMNTASVRYTPLIFLNHMRKSAVPSVNPVVLVMRTLPIPTRRTIRRQRHLVPT